MFVNGIFFSDYNLSYVFFQYKYVYATNINTEISIVIVVITSLVAISSFRPD